MEPPEVRVLPPIPGSVTLDEARDIVRAFGWDLVIRPVPERKPPVGFAPQVS